MPTKTIHTKKETFYFITITCYKWKWLFQSSDIFSYIPEWVGHLNKGGVLLSGYVIMPNHLHLLLYVTATTKSLNKLIGNSKRFLAYQIVKRLKTKGMISILRSLEQGVRREEIRKGKKHQVFQPSFDAKEVQGEDRVLRVLDYIHHNPVSKKWRLVSDFVSYPYSTFYELGKMSSVPLVDYRGVWDKVSSESSPDVE